MRLLPRLLSSRRLLLAALALIALLPARLLAQDVSEYGMKAVLFYRLSQFVYWPGGAPPPKPTILCVVGKNPFGSALNQIDGGNPNIEVRLTPVDLSVCHLLFIPRSESVSLAFWLERSASKQLVTVSDIAGFARAGGMIELPLDGARIGIVLNRRAAQNRGFEFNAQLLRLARVIEP